MREIRTSGLMSAEAFGDMAIDGPMGGEAGSVAEVGRPTRQPAVQSVAHLRPRAVLARPQQLADLVLDALHALLGGTCAQVLLSAFGGELRPQRVAEEVEAFRP